MATALRTLGFIARAVTHRAPCRARQKLPAPPSFRLLSSTTTFRSENVPAEGESVKDFPAALERDEEGILTDLPEEFYGSDEHIGLDEELDDLEQGEEDEPFDTDLGTRDGAEEPKWPPSFFSMDEEKDDPGEDPEFENDDITSLAHGELEQHRELREFARVMAWDMPLLFHHAKAFEPPTAAQPLRFRYTTYLGENHPASRKVVATFDPSSLPDLTPTQSSKLIKLLGVRYNPSTTTAKLSCELYPTTAQNKRYLGDLVDKLLTEARDSTDTFEDVPFDFRHHKPKRRFEFPEEWKMTEERRKELDNARKQRLQLEEGLASRGELVEGTRLIEEMLRPRATSEKEAVMQMATGADQRNKPQKKRAATRLT